MTYTRVHCCQNQTTLYVTRKLNRAAGAKISGGCHQVTVFFDVKILTVYITIFTSRTNRETSQLLRQHNVGANLENGRERHGTENGVD